MPAALATVRPPSPPLARTVLRSSDVDETREVVGAAFCPHSLELSDRSAPLATRYRAVQVGDIGVTVLDYGAPVQITTRGAGDVVLVEIPLGGRSTVTAGGVSVDTDRSTGAVLSLREPATIRRAARSPQLIMRIERTALDEQIRVLTGAPVTTPLRFDTRLDLTTAAGRSWRRLVELFRLEAEQDGALVSQHTALLQLRSLLLTQLLDFQPHNYRAALDRPTPAPLPKLLQRAVDLIGDHAAEPLTVEDIAAATGISVRALQQGFRQHLDCTPTEYLRDIRLERVHADLRAADRTTLTVTDVAFRWGFTHLGRFAGDYRRRFGESPSATLRS